MNDDGPAPVDEILGTPLEPVADPAPAWDAETVADEPIAELHEPPIVPVAEAESRVDRTTAAPEPARVESAPIEPATPTPARSMDPKVIAGAIAAVAALVFFVARWRVRRRRKRNT